MCACITGKNVLRPQKQGKQEPTLSAAYDKIVHALGYNVDSRPSDMGWHCCLSETEICGRLE